MNRPLTTLLSLILAAALLGAAGCGDDDGASSGSDTGASAASETAGSSGSPLLSKRTFIARADQICAEGDAKIDEGGQRFAGTSGEQVDELVHTVIVPGYRNEIEQLRELAPPEGDEAEIERFLNTFEQGIEALDENPEQLAGGAALQTITQARALAFEYGMKGCSRST